MGEVLPLFQIAVARSSTWEAVAVALAIAYLLLAARENSLCWYCALLSSAIYTALFWNVGLLMESVLNVYYMAMAVYGWQQWRYGGQRHEGVAIRTLRVPTHLLLLGSILGLAYVSGWLLTRFTAAAWPYFDSFTSWASVLTTWLVVKKVIENWLYWLVIDSVSIFLYVDRGLYLTALLFVSYLALAVYGYFNWRQSLAIANERTIAAGS